MRGALIHGVLLAVMLLYGYRTWTRDQTIKPDLGSIVLWDKADADLVSIEIKTDKLINRLERRTQGSDSYWWGVETTIEKKAKPADAPKPGEGSGSGSGSAAGSAAGEGSGSGSAAGSGSGSGSAAPAVAEEEVRKTRGYPLGETAEKLIADFKSARALRDLGPPTEEQKKDYKLNDAKTTLTVTFKDGARSFLVGGSVYGGSDRYIVDQKSGRAYVLSKDLISTLEIGESTLHLLDPRGFESNKLESVTIEANGKSKTVVRVTTGVEGQQVKTWGDSDTKKADQTVANFVDNANNLRPTEFAPDVKIADLTPILKLIYKDSAGRVLSTLQLYKREKPGELAPGADLDPANPPKGETEYLITTEKTRGPAIVRRDTAQRTEQDIVTVFSDHPTSIEPKGNPFGNAPLPPPSPHGKPAAPGAGSGSGSAAPAPGAAAPAAPAGGAAVPANPHGAAAPAGGAPAGGAAKPEVPAKPPTPPAKADAKPASGW